MPRARQEYSQHKPRLPDDCTPTNRPLAKAPLARPPMGDRHRPTECRLQLARGQVTRVILFDLPTLKNSGRSECAPESVELPLATAKCSVTWVRSISR